MTRFISALCGVILSTSAAFAQQASPEALEKAVAASWPDLTPELQARVDQDETNRICSITRNSPSPEQAKAIMAREKAAIQYPPDGNYLGDWKKGEKIALDGYGLRMGDDPKRGNGGNCYACHQLAPAEISFGTLGPSLTGYGKLKDFKPEAVREAYERIYNAQSVLACSNMPRFGHNKVLTMEQMKDVLAFLMSPDSPVNK